MNRQITSILRPVATALAILAANLAFGQINCADAQTSPANDAPSNQEEHFDEVMAGLQLERGAALPAKQTAWESFSAPDDFVPVDLVVSQLPLLASRNRFANGALGASLLISSSAVREYPHFNSIIMLLPGFAETSTGFKADSAFAGRTTVHFITLTNLAAMPLDADNLVSAFPATLGTLCQGKVRFEAIVSAMAMPDL